MIRADQVRAAVLSRIRGALGVTERESQRKAAVEDRLSHHPRGTIPARARGNQEAMIELMTTMLNSQGAEVSRAGTAGHERHQELLTQVIVQRVIEAQRE